MAFLTLDHITRSFGTGDNVVKVLKGIDLNIEKGEFCVLLGPSGCGKSTLLNIIGGIDQPDSGSIIINGSKLKDMNDKQLTHYRREHLGYIFQMYNLIANLTVRENIEVGAYLSKKPLVLDELIEVLGLKDHQDKLPNQLSGGQQQRTAIGRAIVKNPSILLCDEPTGALDYQTSKDILNLIININKKYGTTVIMVTHNDAFKAMADRVVLMRDGMILDNYMNDQKLSVDELEW
ncbi:MAG: ABC transporter ATP-binding protein [Erysipelotrichaceae bacterium]|nr:ABC transporter ATP-binding protein [Erysipelotrichaceae bacterium]